MADHRAMTFQVGAARVAMISEAAGLRWQPDYPVEPAALAAMFPELEPDGTLITDSTSAHIQVGDMSVVVDPGHWRAEDRARFRDATFAGAREALGAIGVDPNRVTHVVITHGHYDHFTGVAPDGAPAFPNARHLLPRADWDAESGFGGLGERLHRCLEPVRAAGLLHLVEGDLVLSDEITLVTAPGESPGHQVVRVESGGRLLFLAADLFHCAAEVEHLDLGRPQCDRPTLRESRLRVLGEAADRGAVLAIAHARFPGLGRIARTENGYRWQAGPPGG